MSSEFYGGFRIESFDSCDFFCRLPLNEQCNEIIVSNDIKCIKAKIDEFNMNYS